MWVIFKPSNGLYWSSNLGSFSEEFRGGYTTYSTKGRAEAAIRRGRYLRFFANELQVVPEPAHARAVKAAS
jgi:hypothetical protein